MKAIGIDIGTTTISMVVIQTDNKEIVKAETIQNNSFLKTEHEWERIQDVEVMIHKTLEVLDGLLASYDDIASIGLTGQMHGIVYLNQEGQAVSPLFTWQDGRGNLAELEGLTLVEEINQNYGLRVATGYGLVTHLYNMKKHIIPVGSTTFCTISDYLGMVLTGRKQPLLHSSMAASLGFFDGEARSFYTEKLQLAGMDVTMLPEVSDGLTVLGTYKGIPVTTALGDNQASFLGSVGVKEETVLLNMGTGGQISVLSDQYFEAQGIEARPFIQGKYLLVGASLCGGRAYAILEKFLRNYIAAAGGKNKPQYDTMLQLAQAGEQIADGICVKTTFHGTRSNPDLRGNMTNISEENFTPEAMIYGVLQGMAQELFTMYQVIYKGTGIRAHKLIASGNGLRKNPVLQRIFEKMFQAELAMAPYQEEAACGAAISSMLWLQESGRIKEQPN